MSVQTEMDRISQNIANTYNALEALGCDMPTKKNSDNLAPTAGTSKVVRYNKQTLTEEQKVQARKNIGAVSAEEAKQLYDVECTINPLTLEVVSISHKSADMIKAYTDGKLVRVKASFVGMSVNITSELAMIEDEIVYFFPTLRLAMDGVNAKNYLLKLMVSSATASAEIYEVPKIDDIPTKLSELDGDATHRLVTDTEKQAWNNKSNFSGNYNDLTNKPSIPSLTGYAKESYVQEYAQPKGDYATDKKVSQLEEQIADYIASGIIVVRDGNTLTIESGGVE